MTAVWLIGASGLLGSAMTRAVASRPSWRVVESDPLPWESGPGPVTEAARGAARRFVEEIRGDRWSVIWVAGAAVVASDGGAAEVEFQILRGVLAAIADELRSVPGGSLFYASSAGGVYAGSANPPFDEDTVPVPISPYGELKLRSEREFVSVADSMGADCLIGRIANLYGPGQRLNKLQGLISHLALARLTPRPASIYVSLDTLRDYLFVDDCASVVLDGLERLQREHGSVTKIVASGHAVSIAALLGYFRIISKGHPRVVLGTSAAARSQARDLRLHSKVWAELDLFRPTGLPEGIAATISGVLAALQESAMR